MIWFLIIIVGACLLGVLWYLGSRSTLNVPGSGDIQVNVKTNPLASIVNTIATGAKIGGMLVL